MKLYVQLDHFTHAIITVEIDSNVRREPSLPETLDILQALRSALLIDTPGSKVSFHDPEIPY